MSSRIDSLATPAHMMQLSQLTFAKPGSRIWPKVAPPAKYDGSGFTYKMTIWGTEHARDYRSGSLRLPGAAKNYVDKNATSIEGTAEKHSLSDLILEEVRDALDAGNQADYEAAVERLTQMHHTELELDTISAITTSGNYASGLSGTTSTNWNDPTNSDIYGDVSTMKNAIRTKAFPGVIGECYWVGIGGYDALKHIKDHSATDSKLKAARIIDRREDAIKTQLAQALGIDHLLISDDNYDASTTKGTYTATAYMTGYFVLALINKELWDNPFAAVKSKMPTFARTVFIDRKGRDGFGLKFMRQLEPDASSTDGNAYSVTGEITRKFQGCLLNNATDKLYTGAYLLDTAP